MYGIISLEAALLTCLSFLKKSQNKMAAWVFMASAGSVFARRIYCMQLNQALNLKSLVVCILLQMTCFESLKASQCLHLFEEKIALTDLLSSQIMRRRLSRPEVSRIYESELTSILESKELVDMQLLRKGQGLTYLAKIPKYNLKVIAKKYIPFEELLQVQVNNEIDRIKKRIAREQQVKQFFLNEQLAWIISRDLGLDVFPFGIIKYINGEYWWVQLYVEGAYTIGSLSLSRGQNYEKYKQLIDATSNSKWALRDAILSYLIGDADHTSGNSLFDLKEKRIFYIDAGSAFAIGIDRKASENRNLKLVEPFVFRNIKLNYQHISADIEFFKNLLLKNPKMFYENLSMHFLEDNKIEEFELRLLKLQNQVQSLLR